jgi:hypothetical protein
VDYLHDVASLANNGVARGTSLSRNNSRETDARVRPDQENVERLPGDSRDLAGDTDSVKLAEAVVGVDPPAANDNDDHDQKSRERHNDSSTYGVRPHLSTASALRSTLLIDRFAEGDEALLISQRPSGLSC